jgi:hypothetical protein
MVAQNPPRPLPQRLYKAGTLTLDKCHYFTRRRAITLPRHFKIMSVVLDPLGTLSISILWSICGNHVARLDLIRRSPQRT